MPRPLLTSSSFRKDVATFVDAIQSADVIGAMRKARDDFTEVLNNGRERGITPAGALGRGENMRRVIERMGLTANQVADIGSMLPPCGGQQEEFRLTNKDEHIFAHILRAFDHAIAGTAEHTLAVQAVKHGVESTHNLPKSGHPAAIAAAVELTQSALDPDCTDQQREQASAKFNELMGQIGLNATLVMPDASSKRPVREGWARGEVQVSDKDVCNLVYKLVITDTASAPVLKAAMGRLDRDFAPRCARANGPSTYAEARDALNDVVASLHEAGLTVKYLADIGKQLPRAEGEDAYFLDSTKDVSATLQQATYMRRALWYALEGAQKNAKAKAETALAIDEPASSATFVDANSTEEARIKALQEIGAIMAGKAAEAAEPIQRDAEGQISLRSKMRQQAYDWMRSNPGLGRPDLVVDGRNVLDLEDDPLNTPDAPFTNAFNFKHVAGGQFKARAESCSSEATSTPYLVKNWETDKDTLASDIHLSIGEGQNLVYSMYLSVGGTQEYTDGNRKAYWRIFKNTTFEAQVNDVTGRDFPIVFPPGIYPLYLPADWPDDMHQIVKRLTDPNAAMAVVPVIVTRYNPDADDMKQVREQLLPKPGEMPQRAFWSAADLRDCIFEHLEREQPEMMAYCRTSNDPKAANLYRAVSGKIDELAEDKIGNPDLDTEDMVVAIIQDLAAFFKKEALGERLEAAAKVHRDVERHCANDPVSYFTRRAVPHVPPPPHVPRPANKLTIELRNNDLHIEMQVESVEALLDPICKVDIPDDAMLQRVSEALATCKCLIEQFENKCSERVWRELLYALDRAEAIRAQWQTAIDKRVRKHDELAKTNKLKLAAYRAHSELATEVQHKIHVAAKLRTEGNLDNAARVYKTTLGLLKSPTYDVKDLEPKDRENHDKLIAACEAAFDQVRSEVNKIKEAERKARKAANREANRAAEASAAPASPEPTEEKESPPRNRRDNSAHKRRQRARKREERMIGTLLADEPPSSPETENGDEPKDWAGMATEVESAMRAAAEEAASKEAADLAEAMARSLLDAGPADAAEEEEDPENKLCVVCFEQPKSHACVPCGHQCLCAGCAANPRVNKICPLCRTPVQMVMKVLS